MVCYDNTMLVSDILVGILYTLISLTYVHKVITDLMKEDSGKDLSDNPRYMVFASIYIAIAGIYFYKGLAE